jgi:iron(III) transport system ATP-binding protein
MIPIRIQRLSKRFGAVAALREIDLEIASGELFFVLGPSGCGKTTLLRCLAGFARPDEGRILFGGDDVTGLPPHRRRTGMMFQSYALWPHMTVAENVAFGLEERKVARGEIARRVAETLESVRMGAFGDRRPDELSGGQQQRVALARALVVRPSCLLLDEPLSNLDARLRAEMRAEIRRVCKESGLTAVYVTHDQKEALSIADRMAVIDAGRILQVGAPRELYRRPSGRFVAGFMGETNFIPGTVVSAGSGRVAVDTAIGRFNGVLGDPGARPAAGDAATLSVRPECWRLGSGPAGENAVPGRIAGSVYLGEVAQHAFRSGDAVIKVFELNPRGDGGAPEGASTASVASDDVVALLA